MSERPSAGFVSACDADALALTGHSLFRNHARHVTVAQHPFGLSISESAFESRSPATHLFIAKSSRASIGLEGTVGCPERPICSRAGAIVTLRSTVPWSTRTYFTDRSTFSRHSDSKCLSHEILPNQGRKPAAAYLVHGGVVVIANPNAYDEQFRETNKPGISIILARSGLARGESVEGGPSAGRGRSRKRAPWLLLIPPGSFIYLPRSFLNPAGSLS